MAYYDRIARQWHAATGYHGGPFKRFVLNDLLLERIGSPEDQSILELGAGNGYFCRLMLRRFAGRPPRRLVISDLSPALLETAKGSLNVPGAEYEVLDVRRAFPFPDGTFHLILATMVFNEVSDRGLQRALHECARVLTSRGQLLMTVAHPEFIRDLARRGQLDGSRNKWTMPAAKGLRLPVYRRSVRDYSQDFLFGRPGAYTIADYRLRCNGFRTAARFGTPFAAAPAFECWPIMAFQRSQRAL